MARHNPVDPALRGVVMQKPERATQVGRVFADNVLPVLYIVPNNKGHKRIDVVCATTMQKIDYWQARNVDKASERTLESIAKSIQTSVRALRAEVQFAHFQKGNHWDGVAACGVTDVKLNTNLDNVSCPKCFAALAKDLQKAMEKGMNALTTTMELMEDSA